MKKTLQVVINLITFCFVYGCVLVCSAQPPVPGSYRNVSITDEAVVAAANFAIGNRNETQKTALKLLSIANAEMQIVAGTNYALCLKISNQDKEEEIKAVVFQNLEQKYELSEWNAEKCSATEEKSSNSKPGATTTAVGVKEITEKDLAGIWDAGGDMNKLVVSGKTVQRVLTELAESTIKNFDIKVGDIDFVGVIQGNVIKGSQTFYLDPESRKRCPGLSGTKINAELTLLADGKTFNVVRDDPFFNWDICQWSLEGRPRVTEQMARKP